MGEENKKSVSKTWWKLVLLVAAVAFAYESYWAFVHDDLAPYADTQKRVVYYCFEDVDAGTQRGLCSIKMNGSDFIHYDVPFEEHVPFSINSNGVIAFGCHDPSISRENLRGSEAYNALREICTINADGSNLQQLTHNETHDRWPSINNAGQIAYECTRSSAESGFGICLIDSDRSISYLYDDPKLQALTPVLNNNGLIVFKCYDDQTSNLCRIQSDGLNFQPIQIDGDVSVGLFEVNDHGQIVVNCDRNLLCLVNAEGSDFSRIEMDEGFLPEMSINNNGQIAYACGDKIKSVCVIQFDGDPAQVTQIRPRFSDEYGYSELSINDQGVIAYPCSKFRSKHICLKRADGSDFAVLTKDFTPGRRPEIQE